MSTIEEERVVKDLERAIVAAREAGDDDRLARLQAEYRSVATAERICLGEKPQLRWGSSGQPRSSSRPAIADPPEIRGRSAGAPTVVLTAGVQADFYDFNSELSDGREAAGGLFGQLVGDEILVERATLIRNQLRLRGSVIIDHWQLEDLAEHFRSVGWSLLGDWHTHLGAGPAPASGVDRRAWATVARRRGGGTPWVGLIIQPTHDWLRSDDDWAKPAYHGYLADGAGIETARLILET